MDPIPSSQESLPNTLTCKSDEDDAAFDSQVQECAKVWGRLFPRRVFLQPVDVTRTFVFGRGQECDIVFSPRNLPQKGVNLLSKIHFLILCEDDKVFLQDLSKNGTYVNGKAVGKNKLLLQNDDEIAIGHTKFCLYVFMKFKTEEDPYLPTSLRHKYEISMLLGEGSFGEVRLAFLKESGEQYAIKKIRKGISSIESSNSFNRSSCITNEVNILRSLSHPCIITTYDIKETDQAVFIVLEYMEGGELQKLLSNQENPLPESTVKLIFYQIVLGVQYLHNKGITHRDLKPSNILMKTNKAETLVKVSDFGLSKIVDDNVSMKTTCGTPLYAAPEVVDPRQSTYTQRIDVWSLGVILFYMLSKQLPFNAQNRSNLFYSIIYRDCKMDGRQWKEISGSAQHLVRQMLVKDPTERIIIKDVAQHPWLEDSTMHKIVRQLIKESNIETTAVLLNDFSTSFVQAALCGDD